MISLKKKTTAYLMLLLPYFLTGGLMLHNFYLGKSGKGVIQLVLWLGLWFSLFAGVFLEILSYGSTGGGFALLGSIGMFPFSIALFVFAIVDLVKMNDTIKQVNKANGHTETKV